jgi:O-acetyl-ADP-ribose deacetylase (regulator of RNase III)
LKISSVGTEIKKNSRVMPDGSALLTDTGNNSSLQNQGINYIIHVVPKTRNSCSSDEEFIEIAVKAAQNSIILADREGIKSLAICFIAGKIYLGSCPPEKLAQAIIMGALDQIEENRENLKKIIFVAFKKDDPDPSKEIYEPYLVDAFDKVKRASTDYFVKCQRFAEIVKGDICDKGIHGAEAIVNSENAQMG